jgi:hypothetical protein
LVIVVWLHIWVLYSVPLVFMSVFVLLTLFSLGVLGFGLRALHMLGRHSTT